MNTCTLEDFPQRLCCEWVTVGQIDRVYVGPPLASTNVKFREFLTMNVKSENLFPFSAALAHLDNWLKSLIELIGHDSEKFIEHRDEIITLRNWIVELIKEQYRIGAYQWLAIAPHTELLEERAEWDTDPLTVEFPQTICITFRNLHKK